MSEDNQTLPVHIGFIVDGNRRWAKKHGLPTYEGHLAGYNSLKDVLLEVLRCGVTYVSAYVFSTENWKRSTEEVGHLIKLFVKVLEADVPIFIDNNVRLRVIGSRDNLPSALNKAINAAEEKTKDLDGGQLLLCLNYGGHLEIVDAVKKIIRSGVKAEDVTADCIADNLYAPEVPPCDLIVRTSGEQRLSNFMLWRSAYSEMLFIEKNWPDMKQEDVRDILDEYARRNRRFGGE